MSNAIGKLQDAMERGKAGAPKVNGFPYLAETMRQAGASRNLWQLPSCQSIFYTTDGPVAVQGKPLIEGMADVPAFNEAAIIAALEKDAAGESTFEDFLTGIWEAGVVNYNVDFDARKVSYYGVNGEVYIQTYETVTL